ncbi:MAG TPA: polysaccharide lyase family protein [Tepidisphaeraceae bacterium]
MAVMAAGAVCMSGLPASATITLSEHSSADWAISNGDLNVVYDPAGGKITSVAIGSSGNILDPSNSNLYPEFAGTPFGSGAQTFGVQQTSSYIDFWTTTASTGTSTNPLTYSFHYVMFNNDPNIVCYEVLNHSATDPATSVGQGQFLARVNPNQFYNTVQENVGPNNPGLQTSTLDNASQFSTVSAQAGRGVQDATTDLSGSGLAGDWGGNFYTKYDYSSYTQFLQANTEYGSNYSVSAIFTGMDTMTGGPTKQNLQFTNNIAMIEFLSDHYATSDPNYAYTPPQGVNSSRLFGPYDFRFVATNGESGTQLEQDAISSMDGLESDYNTDAELIANGYVPTNQRGSMQITASNSAGWSTNTTNNTVVLSDPNKSFQESNSGNQYWAQLSSNGTATISNIVPGTYRLTLYQLGQWGETRVDGVQVIGNQIALPQNLKFTPENFSKFSPIWTIGTPDRSAHEFLNGTNTSSTDGVTQGGDLRQYYGNYDYWAEEQALGTPGQVVYYATAVGSTPATNNPQKWIANQWGKFDPGLYDASNGTTDNYANVAPQYVKDAGGPATYSGSPWDVNFACTQTQLNQGQYVVLSVGLAAVEASLVVTLNGHEEIWHYGGASNTPISVASDPMVRSGDAGVYQFLVFQFPTSDLNAAGQLDQFTFGVSQSDGVMYDALRMEITNTSAAPSTTGWYDYEYITGANSQIDADDAVGFSANEKFVPEPTGIVGISALIVISRRKPKRQ